MRFLGILRSTKLNRQQLLDIALVLALLPHLLILKLPMLIYLTLALIFIVKKKDSKVVLISFAVLGVIAIALSFMSEYNFSNFSRLLVFISLLIALLSWAVVLQRLTRQINFYLTISPAMLMILSFFFYNSIGMLFYALFTLFTFTLLLLYERMQSSISNALRINALLYLFSLPIVLLLFITFPRISYKNAKFGFKAEQIKRTGHDGTMYLDSKSLLVPSPRLVMEVDFEKGIPADRALYFRGSALYTDKGTRWVQDLSNKTPMGALKSEGESINYTVKLYPHQKKWLYMLDLPLSHPDKSVLDSDLIVHSYTDLNEVYHYEGKSAFNLIMPQESATKLDRSLQVDPKRDPQSYAALQKSVDIRADDLNKANQLLSFFSSMDLAYSLKPKAIDLEYPVDSFLFDSKVGYCVHFASAFASCARMVGLPSRIIPGYKADRANAINNYLLVKEADAHAWVELYIQGQGWMRFEPTSTASRILTPDNDPNLSNSYTTTSMQLSTMQKVFKQANLYYMYSRYVINTWVLQYSRSKQLSLLNDLLTNTLFLLKFIAAIAGFILMSIALFVLLQKKKCTDALLCEMQVLMQLLKSKGYIRYQGETMFDFLKRVMSESKAYAPLAEISTIYHEQRYGEEKKQDLTQLRAKIQAFKKKITSG
jgi:transglutaminase-like putative cysteine protease